MAGAQQVSLPSSKDLDLQRRSTNRSPFLHTGTADEASKAACQTRKHLGGLISST